MGQGKGQELDSCCRGQWGLVPWACQHSLCHLQQGSLGNEPHPAEVFKGSKCMCLPTLPGIMDTWAFPAALFLFCLTSESLQGGEGRQQAAAGSGQLGLRLGV